LVLLVTAVGCGGDDVPVADAGADAARADAGPMVAAPMPPLPPVLTPCAAGWVQSEIDGIPICEPWPGSMAPSCGDAEAAFPGEPACVALGSACPSGEFPEGLPTDVTVLYVSASASAGGDGSAVSPFDTIGGAMAEARTDTVIAVGKGVYDETVTLRAGVTLFGACVAETTLTSSASNPTAGVVTIAGSGVEIRNLRIADAARAGITSTGRGSTATIRDLIVEDVAGFGLDLGEGAFTLRRVAIRRTANPGLATVNGEVEAQWLEVTGAGALGVLAEGSAAVIRLSDTVIRAGRADGAGNFGNGVLANDGATVEGVRVAVLEMRETAVTVGTGARLILRDSLVARVLGRVRDDLRGRGVATRGGGVVDVERTTVRNSRLEAVSLLQSEVPHRLADVVIAQTGPTGNGFGGRGIAAHEGAIVEGVRVHIVDGFELGVFVFGAGTEVSLSDLVVRDIEAKASDDESGRGLNVDEGAVLTLDRALVERVRDIGVLVARGSQITATDLVIRDVQSRANDGSFGRGVEVAGGSTGRFDRVLIERVREAGVIALTEGDVALTDVVVDTVMARDCIDAGCFDGVATYGMALVTAGAGRLRAERFAVTDPFLCGALIATGGESDLSQGAIRGAEVGVCVQVDGYDLERLTDRVAFSDNGANLETTTLPVPGTGEPLAE